MTDQNQVALRYLARRALRRGTLPSTFRRLVTQVHQGIESYQRVAYVVETREIHPCSSPGHGTKRKEIVAFPSGAGLDPWTVDAARLQAESARVSQCPRCDGSKKEPCSTCSGVGRLPCGECGGGGQVAGQRGPKKCPGCRGRGTRRCTTCRSGLVECGACEGVGRVNAWLDVRLTQSMPIRAHPEGGLASRHPKLLDVENVDADPSDFSNQLIADSGWTQSPPADLRPELTMPLDSHTDRIVRCRLQEFSGPVVRVDYATRLSAATVAVGGRPLGVLPESSWKPLEQRGKLALAIGVAVLVAALVVRVAYLNRGPWFELFGAGTEFGVWAIAIAIAATVAMLGALLPNPARKGWRVVVPTVAFLVGCVAASGLWLTAVPTVEEGEAALERGDFGRASVVAQALVAESRDSTDAERIQAAVDEHEAIEVRERKAARVARAHQEDVEHLARVTAATTPSGAGRAIAGIWNDHENYEHAAEVFRRRAAEAVAPLYAANDEDELRALAVQATALVPKVAARAEVRADLIKAERCRMDREFRCAVDVVVNLDRAADDKEAARFAAEIQTRVTQDVLGMIGDPRVKTGVSLRQEQAQLQQWIDYGDLYVRVSGDKPPANIGRARRRLVVVNKRIQRQADKAAREDAQRTRAAERKERRQERKTERKTERSWGGSGHVQCCDGTMSPTCTYAHRGCCSHHGGVC